MTISFQIKRKKVLYSFFSPSVVHYLLWTFSPSLHTLKMQCHCLHQRVFSLPAHSNMIGWCRCSRHLMPSQWLMTSPLKSALDCFGLTWIWITSCAKSTNLTQDCCQKDEFYRIACLQMRIIQIMQDSVESFINVLESYRGRDKVVSLYLHVCNRLHNTYDNVHCTLTFGWYCIK